MTPPRLSKEVISSCANLTGDYTVSQMDRWNSETHKVRKILTEAYLPNLTIFSEDPESQFSCISPDLLWQFFIYFPLLVIITCFWHYTACSLPHCCASSLISESEADRVMERRTNVPFLTSSFRGKKLKNLLILLSLIRSCCISPWFCKGHGQKINEWRVSNVT